MSYAYDTANRVSAITGPSSKSYASSITYAPHGALSGATFGTHLTEAWAYNSRLQPSAISVTNSSAGTVFGTSLYYCLNSATVCSSNNGNLLSATLNPLGVTQTFTYDAVNRIATAAEGTAWSQTYGHDRYGRTGRTGQPDTTGW